MSTCFQCQILNLKIEHLEEQNKFLQEQLAKYDTYVMMSLGNHSTKGPSSNNVQIVEKMEPLMPHIEKNLDTLNSSSIKDLLNISSKYHDTMVNLLKYALTGEKSKCPVVLSNRDSIVKYQDADQQKTINVVEFADIVCTMVYNKCLPIVRTLNEEQNDLTYTNDTQMDKEHTLDNNRINNLNLLRNKSNQIDLLKRVVPFIK